MYIRMYITEAAQRAIETLPDGFTERGFSDDFLLLPVMLQLYGFSITRVEDAAEYVDFHAETSYHYDAPSVDFRAKESSNLLKQYHKIREEAASPDDTELNTVTGQLIRVNLRDVQKMYNLLAEFYATRRVEFGARIIIENNDIMGARLRPQESIIQPLLNEGEQRRVANESQQEMIDFGLFLMYKYERHV